MKYHFSQLGVEEDPRSPGTKDGFVRAMNMKGKDSLPRVVEWLLPSDAWPLES